MTPFGRPLLLSFVRASMASVSAENGRDLTKASPQSVGIPSERLKRLEPGNWIDAVSDLTFVGMIQHRGRVNAEIQTISRNPMYQALVN